MSPRREPRKQIVCFLASKSELRAIKDAAQDAHLTHEEYCRLMVLAAAGMGGVLEHLGRAIEASVRAEVR